MRMARGIRGGGGQYRGVPPQRGGLHPGARQPRGGGLAAMMQQRGALHPGAQGPGGGWRGAIERGRQQSPGQPLHPGAQGPGGGGFMSRLRQMVQQQQAQAGGPRVSELPPGGGMDDLGTGGVMGGQYDPGRVIQGRPSDFPDGGPGGRMGLDPYSEGELRRRGPRGPLAPGGGGGPLQLPIMDRPNPNIGRPGYDPIGDMGPITGPGTRPWKQRRRIAPPPGKFPQGDERGPMIPGGPRVPPNMQGYLQRQRMMNRPPANVGGGGNRVGMQDQQGGVARALQRGTGRPPMSRRMGFGRAGRRR